jgi:hypothetical protein
MMRNGFIALLAGHCMYGLPAFWVLPTFLAALLIGIADHWLRDSSPWASKNGWVADNG